MTFVFEGPFQKGPFCPLMQHRLKVPVETSYVTLIKISLNSTGICLEHDLALLSKYQTFLLCIVIFLIINLSNFACKLLCTMHTIRNKYPVTQSSQKHSWHGSFHLILLGHQVVLWEAYSWTFNLLF